MTTVPTNNPIKHNEAAFPLLCWVGAERTGKSIFLGLILPPQAHWTQAQAQNFPGTRAGHVETEINQQVF